FPTVLDALGVSPAPQDADLPGVSLLGLATREDRPRLGFSEYHAIGSPSAAFMLTDGRHKYHPYVGYEPELFDLLEDPEETTSLHASPSHQDVLHAFERRLRSALDPLAVDRLAKDDQNRLVERMGGREAALGIGKIGATPVPR